MFYLSPAAQRRNEKSTSFLKKRSKRLLFLHASGKIVAVLPTSRSDQNKSLFASFSSEKEDSSFSYPGRGK
jgi:hypothetical protein